MTTLVEDHIERLIPYSPGKPIGEVERELGLSDVIKLASNENPMGPSPRAMEAVHAAVEDLHYYPDGGAYYLKSALADRLDIDIVERFIPTEDEFSGVSIETAMQEIRLRSALRYPEACDISSEVREELNLQDE